VKPPTLCGQYLVHCCWHCIHCACTAAHTVQIIQIYNLKNRRNSFAEIKLYFPWHTRIYFRKYIPWKKTGLYSRWFYSQLTQVPGHCLFRWNYISLLAYLRRGSAGAIFKACGARIRNAQIVSIINRSEFPLVRWLSSIQPILRNGNIHLFNAPLTYVRTTMRCGRTRL
jgi:hypothetical protein